MKKYKTRFDRIYFRNRWRMKKYSRPCDWTIVWLEKIKKTMNDIYEDSGLDDQAAKAAGLGLLGCFICFIVIIAVIIIILKILL